MKDVFQLSYHLYLSILKAINFLWNFNSILFFFFFILLSAFEILLSMSLGFLFAAVGSWILLAIRHAYVVEIHALKERLESGTAHRESPSLLIDLSFRIRSILLFAFCFCRCDFLNFSKNKVCLKCNCVSPKRMAGEWNCPSWVFLTLIIECLSWKDMFNSFAFRLCRCDFLNFSRNKDCIKCKCKAPQGSNNRIWRTDMEKPLLSY
jgi:uncharacterized membrane protein